MFLQVYVVALALFLQKCIRLNGVYYIFVYFYILSCIMQTSDIQSFSVYEQLDRVHASIVPDWINSRAPSSLFVQTLSRDRVDVLLSNISLLRARIEKKNEGYLDYQRAQKYMNLLTLEKAIEKAIDNGSLNSAIEKASIYQQLERVQASIVPEWINSRAPSGLFVQTLSRDRVYNLLSNISSLRARIGEKNEGYLDSSKAQKYMNLLTLEKALHESRKRDLKIGLNAFQQTGSAYHTRCKMPTYYV